VEAMDKEVMKCFDMGTWEIVDTADIPPECSVIGTCFSFKVNLKCDSEGKLLECQTGANINGTQQKPGSLTYGETFAPSSKFSVVCTICAIVALQEIHTLYRFDVKGDFLLLPCKEPVHMNLPGRYKLPTVKAFKCKKLLYALKQSAFEWHEMISGWLLEHGFENLDTDGVMFEKAMTKQDGTVSKLLITIHVDAIVATNDDEYYQKYMDELGTSFELSASGKLIWFLRCKVEREGFDQRQGAHVTRKILQCVLKRSKMSDDNAVHTPREANQHLQASDSLCVCVLLCFVDPILGKSRSRCHFLNQGTSGGRIPHPSP